MWPAAIALNYSVRIIQNDVCQIIITIHIWKIAMQLTSVGLTHARPSYNYQKWYFKVYIINKSYYIPPSLKIKVGHWRLRSVRYVSQVVDDLDSNNVNANVHQIKRFNIGFCSWSCWTGIKTSESWLSAMDADCGRVGDSEVSLCAVLMQALFNLYQETGPSCLITTPGINPLSLCGTHVFHHYLLPNVQLVWLVSHIRFSHSLVEVNQNRYQFRTARRVCRGQLQLLHGERTDMSAINSETENVLVSHYPSSLVWKFVQTAQLNVWKLDDLVHNK